MNTFFFLVFLGAQIISYNYELSNSDRWSIYDKISKTSVTPLIKPTPDNHFFKIEEKEPYSLKLYVDCQLDDLKEITIKKVYLKKNNVTIDLIEQNQLDKNVLFQNQNISLLFDKLPINSVEDNFFILEIELEIKNINNEIFSYSEEFQFNQKITKGHYFPTT